MCFGDGKSRVIVNRPSPTVPVSLCAVLTSVLALAAEILFTPSSRASYSKLFCLSLSRMFIDLLRSFVSLASYLLIPLAKTNKKKGF